MQITRFYRRCRQTLASVGQPAVALAMRLTLAVVFVQSGWGKLHNLAQVVEFFTQLGIPYPSLQAPMVATTEVVAGILLGLGLGARLAALPVAVMMGVAISTARRAELTGLGDLLGFVEYLYLVLAAAVAVYGPGPWALDALFSRRIAQRPA